MTLLTFESVIAQPTKTGKCFCGVRRTRNTKIESTINPFNKNDKGLQKSYSEVKADVDAEAKEWMSDPITGSKCEVPSYWKWTPEQRKAFDEIGHTHIHAKNGMLFKVTKRLGKLRLPELAV